MFSRTKSLVLILIGSKRPCVFFYTCEIKYDFFNLIVETIIKA